MQYLFSDNVLDIACGTGNTTITAKRLANAKVIGVDFTPEILAQAKEEASLAEVEDIEWKEGNVEDLPFEDESFDVVLSSFGHMFSPHPEVAINEMLRVTKREMAVLHLQRGRRTSKWKIVCSDCKTRVLSFCW